ncbi:FAD-dependent oxidoreductase [Roseomonas sp. NAR14]|uniref:FAD-dependent oxidoreductase n=1 Tax=Roseomonas acroporae TaxID=2937791 RepID=A0A9X2BVZ6_9PROT|nr:FAD-dependent oxidoreductase [Roseomonas acroporae]MCK8787183.1 FAD-dependent oxidoreductase [Roseomonas acroporae]
MREHAEPDTSAARRDAPPGAAMAGAAAGGGPTAARAGAEPATSHAGAEPATGHAGGKPATSHAATAAGAAAPEECDLLVIGSGAGGLAAAVTAAFHGLRVIVVEKEPVFGGATAWSGGWMWVPRNPLARRAGIEEDPEAPRTYLRHELGNRYDAARVEAFLENGPRMVAFFEANTALQFEAGNRICDIHGATPGAGTGGRSVIAAPYDARRLGALLPRLRRPMRETTLLGLGIQAGPDLAAFMNATRSARAAWHVARRVGRHLYDLARHGRATQLVNGSALVARLARSAADLGVEIRVSSPARSLIVEDGAVRGAVIGTPDGERAIRARRGVVLASGGFPHEVARRRELFPNTPTGHEHWSVAVPSATGDGLRLGESAGGAVDRTLASAAAWCPVSLVPWPDGTVGHFPHIIERAKPGIVAVRRDGRRFVNEADGYYDVVAALLRATPPGEEAAAWLVCTRAFQRRYGLGVSKPAPVPVAPWIRAGYIREGRTVAELAAACGIDPAGLAATLAEYNRHARRGEDPEFGRGSTPYNRYGGDASVTPNPCVAPIETGPFYAVKVVPGSFGTFAGLKADAEARVLDGAGRPIPGLYAAGSDMASVMGGYYPAGGINLGPAMTFGFIAGRHAAGEAVAGVAATGLAEAGMAAADAVADGASPETAGGGRASPGAAGPAPPVAAAPARGEAGRAVRGAVA